jgi:hypothetical protein
VNADGGLRHVGAVGGNGVADTGEVGSDNREFFAERWEKRNPHPRSFGKTVKQDYSWTVTTGRVVEFLAINVGVFGDEARQ